MPDIEYIEYRIPCPKCAAWFRDIASLNKHIEHEHPQKEKKRGRRESS
jgi:uncharacterized C2H2 Zn-finger protein